jgi:hypothetical protein
VVVGLAVLVLASALASIDSAADAMHVFACVCIHMFGGRCRKQMCMHVCRGVVALELVVVAWGRYSIRVYQYVYYASLLHGQMCMHMCSVSKHVDLLKSSLAGKSFCPPACC